MFQVLLPRKTRFKQFVDRLEKISGILVFHCSKNGIYVSAMNPELDCAVLIDLITAGFTSYICPDGGIIYAVERLELTEAMRKSKENHGNSILLTIPNVDRMDHLLIDFLGGHTEDVKQMQVKILTKYPKFKMNIDALPDYKRASICITNSKVVNRFLNIMTYVADDTVKMTMEKDKLEIKVDEPTGDGTLTLTHGFDMDDYKNYSERDIFAQPSKQHIDFVSIKMNPEHGLSLSKVYSLASLVAHEQPTTNSSRVEIGMMPTGSMYFFYKLPDAGSYTFITGNIFAPEATSDGDADASEDEDTSSTMLTT
jgi:hypothetical protein